MMVLPNGYVAAEELVAGCTAAIGWGSRRGSGADAARWSRGWPRWPCTTPGRQAVDDGYTMAARRRCGPTRIGARRHRERA